VYSQHRKRRLRLFDHADGMLGIEGALPAPAADDWEQVRRQFPLDRKWIHMSQFFLASHPFPVRAGLDALRRGLDENPFAYVEDNIARLEKATRAAASAHMGCKPDDLAELRLQVGQLCQCAQPL